MDRDVRSAQDELRWDSEDEFAEEAGRFEKITRRERVALPVSSESRTARSAKETFASRRIRKVIAKKSGGMHLRRRKKVR
jgi:hypothetical protein